LPRSCHADHLLFARIFAYSGNRLLLFDFSVFGRPALILSGLYRVLFEFSLPFFLVLFLFRQFLLTLLKIKIRFSHSMPPHKGIPSTKPRRNECGPDKRPARCSQKQCPFSLSTFPQIQVRSFDAADDCDGLPGLGPEPDGRDRFRSFRFRFCASSCFLFFFTEGFS
jgi:hypothetical protein